MFKNSILVTLSVVFFLLCSQTVLAASPSIVIDGERQRYSSDPIIENGVTLVPLRGVFETLGVQVDWNQQARSISASKNSESVFLTIGSKNAKVNGKNIALSVPPQLINNVTMVPLRFISESLGADVDWNSSTKTVSINSPNPTSRTTPASIGQQIEISDYSIFRGRFTYIIEMTEVITGDSAKDILQEADNFFWIRDDKEYILANFKFSLLSNNLISPQSIEADNFEHYTKNNIVNRRMIVIGIPSIRASLNPRQSTEGFVAFETSGDPNIIRFNLGNQEVWFDIK